MVANVAKLAALKEAQSQPPGLSSSSRDRKRNRGYMEKLNEGEL